MLAVKLLATMLLVVLVDTSVGGGLRNRAVRLTLGRLIEQDEVLLIVGQVQWLQL